MSKLPFSSLEPRLRVSAPGVSAWPAMLCMVVAGCSLDVAPQTPASEQLPDAAGWMPAATSAANRVATGQIQGMDAEAPSQAPDSGSASSPASSAANDAGVDAAATVSTSGPSNAATTSTPPGAMPAAKESAPPAPKPEMDAGQPSQSPMSMDASTPPPDAAADARDAAGGGAAPSHCRPGFYAGTFNGSMQLLGLPVSSVTGTVRAELKHDGDPTRLTLTDAVAMGVNQDGNLLNVALTGSINCVTHLVEAGRLEHGVFRDLQTGEETTFAGTTEGTHAEDPHSVVGTWMVETTDTALIGGQGTWSLLLSEQPRMP